MGDVTSLGKDPYGIELRMSVQGDKFDLATDVPEDRHAHDCGPAKSVRIWEDADAETAFRAGVEMALHAAFALRGARIAALRAELADSLRMVVGP